MSEVKDSESFSGLSGLFLRYKKFAFEVLSKVPYGQKAAWEAFADNRVEEALKERRSVGECVRDVYALTILGIASSLIGFWYVWLIVGGMLLLLAGMLGFLGMLVSPVWTAAIIAGIVIFMLIWPGVSALVRAAYYLVMMRFFGGHGSYSDTLRVLVLTRAAGFTLMIPLIAAYAVIIGFLFGPLSYVVSFYALYLQYRGMKHVHGMESRNAAVATIVALVIEVGAFMALYIAVYIGMMALRMGYS